MINPEQTIVVNTLRNTSDEKHHQVMDNGMFIDDLAKHGLEPLVTNRDSYDTGVVLRPRLEADGTLVFNPETVAVESLSNVLSMHNRVLGEMLAPAAASIPMLNANELKQYASSKYRLYNDVLEPHQVHTELLTIDKDSFSNISEIVDAVASESVIIKSNSGSGGSSTEVLKKSTVVEWAQELLKQDKKGEYIIQPKIEFGPIPQGIQGVTEDEKALINRARSQNLLSELRMLTVKSGEKFQFVPVMRVVVEQGQRMGSASDTYVDVNLPDELNEQLCNTSKAVVAQTAEKAGDIQNVLAAVDYYFTPSGEIKIMEANFRSPQIPRTRNNPVAGRQIHQAVASALASMERKV